MVIKRKAEHLTVIEQSIGAIINRGGRTTAEVEAIEEKTKNEPEEIRFTLRLPSSLMDSIDKKRKERIGNISRNQWIVETLSKALK